MRMITKKDSDRQNRDLLVVLVLLIIGAAFRLADVNRCLWLDEAYSVFYAKAPTWLQAIKATLKYDVHPPLYYLLLRAWTSIFGTEVFFVRLPSVLAGLITIPLVAHLARKFDATWRSYIPPLLISISPVAINYSNQVRFYAFTPLLFALLVLFWLEVGQKKYRLLLAFIVALVMCYFQGALAVIVIPMWVAFAIVKSVYSKKLIPTAIISSVLFLLSAAPWIIYQLQRPAGGLLHLGQFTFSQYDDILIRILFQEQNEYKFFNILFTAMILVGLVFSISGIRKNPRKLILLISVLLPIAVVQVFSLFRPVYSLRLLVFMQVPAVLILISGYDSALFKRKTFRIARDLFLIVLVIMAMVVAVLQNHGRVGRPAEQWDSVVQLIQDQQEVPGQIYFTGPFGALPYAHALSPQSLDGSASKDFECYGRWNIVNSFDPLRFHCVNDIEEHIPDAGRMWIIGSHKKARMPKSMKERIMNLYDFKGIKIYEIGYPE